MEHYEEKLIRALWPLPGGNSRYLDTLNRAVKWSASEPNVTHEALLKWFQAQYNVSEGSAIGYARVIYTLGALELVQGQVRETLFGRRFLEAEGEAKARLVIERFMHNYLGFREVLAVYERAGRAIHIDEMVACLQPYFPGWTSAAQYEYRALWLLSLDALEQDHGRHYLITGLGRELARQYPPIQDINAEPPQTVIKAGHDEIESVIESEQVLDFAARLAAELREAATDSQHSQRLEQAVAEAFHYLGFSVDHLGASGETDVIARAHIGSDSYVVVVDAKARSGGKVNDLNIYTLVDHRKDNQADYAVVVAGDFAGGKVASHAAANGVVLLPISLLTQVLRLHAQTPLSLNHYRPLFTSPGLRAKLPDALELAAENQVKWGQLLVDLIELIREVYYEQGLLEPLPRETIFYMLASRLGGVRHSKNEVQQAIDFLAHPAIGAIRIEETAFSLVMDRSTLVRTLRALANRIDTSETETEE